MSNAVGSLAGQQTRASYVPGGKSAIKNSSVGTPWANGCTVRFIRFSSGVMDPADADRSCGVLGPLPAATVNLNCSVLARTTRIWQHRATTTFQFMCGFQLGSFFGDKVLYLSGWSNLKYQPCSYPYRLHSSNLLQP